MHRSACASGVRACRGARSLRGRLCASWPRAGCVGRRAAANVTGAARRAGRGPSFALSPVLPPQGDSPKSQSWLNAQPAITSPQANWLSSAAVPDTAPDTARSNASANWLQAHDPKSEQLEPQHSDSSSSASARTVPAQAHGTRKRASRPLNAADGAPNARRAGALPPLPLTLPPLPLTPTSTTSKESARALTLSGATTQSKGTESGTGARSERPDDAQFAHSDEGKSRGSGGSTPITPSDDPDQDDFQGVHPDSLRDSLRQAVIGPLMLASASQEGQRGRQSKGASAKRGFNVRPQQDNAVPQNQSHLIENGRARDAMSTQGNGHASAAHHRQSFTWGDQTSKGGDDQMIGPPFLNVASHARERDDGNSSPQSLEDADPLRKPHRFGSNKMRSSDSLSKLGIAIREHLNHAHFACGFVADTDQSARQRRAYEFYFSSWKRCLVSSVVLVHSALAFAELSTSADVRAEVMWRAADAWMQALHFLCVLVYLADATLLAIGLTVANLDPRRNSRNATCLLLTLAVAADTLLTAMMVETSSFSLPLRACLLVRDHPPPNDCRFHPSLCVVPPHNSCMGMSAGAADARRSACFQDVGAGCLELGLAVSQHFFRHAVPRSACCHWHTRAVSAPNVLPRYFDIYGCTPPGSN